MNQTELYLGVVAALQEQVAADGDDTYWVASAIGGFTEYFKRTTYTGTQRQPGAEQ